MIYLWNISFICTHANRLLHESKQFNPDKLRSFVRAIKVKKCSLDQAITEKIIKTQVRERKKIVVLVSFIFLLQVYE